MLTTDQTNTLISIIDKLEDLALKEEFISQLNNLIIWTEEAQKTVDPICMKKIYNRFKGPNQQITVEGLQEEIRNLKQEIQILKENDISLEYRLLELEGKETIKNQIENNEKEKVYDGRYINLLIHYYRINI